MLRINFWLLYKQSRQPHQWIRVGMKDGQFFPSPLLALKTPGHNRGENWQLYQVKWHPPPASEAQVGTSPWSRLSGAAHYSQVTQISTLPILSMFKHGLQEDCFLKSICWLSWVFPDHLGKDSRESTNRLDSLESFLTIWGKTDTIFLSILKINSISVGQRKAKS